LGRNSKIEISTNIPSYALVIPKNPNIQDSPYFVVEGEHLSITTKEQSQEDDTFYSFSHDAIALKQVTKNGFSFTNSFEKSYQENSLTLLEVAGLNLLVQKSILGDGTQLVIDFTLKGDITDIKVKTNNLSALLLKTRGNHVQVSEMNKSINTNDIQYQSYRDSGFTLQAKESQEFKLLPLSNLQKPRAASFLDENGVHVRKPSFMESYGYQYPRKESSHMFDSNRGNDETEEFYEAFEDLAEMLEAEQVIEDDFKLEIGRDSSANVINKNKSQTTFQFFTLKYIRWSCDIGIQSLSVEIGLEEDFGLMNSCLIFEQKDILIQASLAPEETNVNMMYSSMKLQYSQKRNLENEKCFEIKSVGTEQNKNMISFLRKDGHPMMSTFNLGKIHLELQPSVTNEMVQLSKAFLARKGSSDEPESPSPTEPKPALRIGVDIHSFHIRLIGHDNNYVELQTQSLKLYKEGNGGILNSKGEELDIILIYFLASFEGLRFKIVNSKQKTGYDLFQNSKKQVHGESRITLEKSLTDGLTIDINNLK